MNMETKGAITYYLPDNWIKYDPVQIATALVNAKSAVIALTSIPYQRSWADKLQEVQLKREVAGTSRIEGADFTDDELETALTESPAELWTRSQRQAAATKRAYRWIASLPSGYPVDKNTILEIHRLIVENADDDHCPPGVLRSADQNVTFGTPRHRGATGGPECELAFEGLIDALNGNMAQHDAVIQGLALHYHLAAMHPFLDGNGRTARALEALMLQRVGLRDTLFIAMSNYYYEEKIGYLTALAEVRRLDFDLTPFLIFALKGIELQCRRLLQEIRTGVEKVLFRDVMHQLYNRLESPRKRVIRDRQLGILELLLETEMLLDDLIDETLSLYRGLKKPGRALTRDLLTLNSLGAIEIVEAHDTKIDDYVIRVRLRWAAEITQTDFFERIEQLPTAKTHPFLNRRSDRRRRR